MNINPTTGSPYFRPPREGGRARNDNSKPSLAPTPATLWEQRQRASKSLPTENDTPESLARRLLPVEHELYPRALAKACLMLVDA